MNEARPRLEPFLTLAGVSFAYGQPAPAADRVPVFQDLDWLIGRGDAWAVLGPSGCGKSTLLYLLAGLLRPTAGAISVGAEVLAGPRPSTGLILQDYGLLPWATAERNVALGLEIRRFYGQGDRHVPAEDDFHDHDLRIAHWMARLRLQPHAHKYPGQLSGGQRQRVAIARTLALNPDLLLMDEPFSSLDAPTRESLQDLTYELRAEADLTTVIVTHAIEEAAILGRRIMVLHQPPNRRPIIIDNPDAGDPDYRHRPAYFEMVRRLRRHLEGEA